MDLIDVFKNKKIGDKVTLEGWVRNNRDQKEFGFIDFYDGTSINTLQIVYDKNLSNFDEVAKILAGSSIMVEGELVESNGKQAYEVKPSKIEIIGDCPADYPIQPKRHTMEFLRSQAYLRPRTKTFQAVFKIRSVTANAIHEYFQNNNYVYVHTPLLTTADCEGSDQMFKVTTLDLNNVPKEDGKVDYSKDLFNKQTYITGSGQLHGETFAMAFKKIYTFGPTFRTENSNTKTHANEFWMIEPEMAFMHLDDLMNVEDNREKNIPSYECGLFVDGCDSSPINVTLIFLTEPQKCIDFKGNVEDKTKDLRTIEAYKETGEGLTIGALVKFYQFYITPEMYEQAELCE